MHTHDSSSNIPQSFVGQNIKSNINHLFNLSKALKLRKFGLQVAPAKANKKLWLNKWKHLQSELQTTRTIKEWFTQYSHIEYIAIISGKVSNWVFAIDFDDTPLEQLPIALKLLGLPIDYQWAYPSQSGKGFHIWVRCQNINLPQNRYELITGDHVELRYTGYTLFYGNVPNISPLDVSQSAIEGMIETLSNEPLDKRKNNGYRPPQITHSHSSNLHPQIVQTIESALQTQGMILTGRRWSKNFSCPNHTAHNEGDKNPSAAYDTHNQVVKCWACGVLTLKDLAPMLGINWQELLSKYVCEGDTLRTPQLSRRQENKAQSTIIHSPLGIENTLENKSSAIAQQFDLSPVKSQPIGTEYTFSSRWLYGKRGIPSITALFKLNIFLSAMGTGKTYAVGMFLKELERTYDENQRVIIILHRTTLNIDTRKRLEDMGFYILSHIDIGNLSSYAIHDKLVITVDSLHHLQNQDFTLPHYDIVFIDEIEEVLKHSVIGTIKGIKSRVTIALMYQLIRQAETAILASANAGLNTSEFVNNSGIDPADIFWIHNMFKRPDLPDYRLVSSQDILIAELAQALKETGGAGVLYFSNSKSEIKTLASYFAQPENGGYDILAIHSDNTDDPHTRDKIANLSTELAERAVFATGSINSGFDIQTKDVRIFGNYRHVHIMNPEEITQQTGRARHARSLTIYIPEDNRTPRPFTKDEILQSELIQYHRNYKVLIGAGGIPELSTEDCNHLNLWATIKAKENYFLSYRRSATLALLDQAGYYGTTKPDRELTPAELKLKTAISEHKAMIKANTAEKKKIIAPVDDLTLRRKQYKGTATTDDRLGNEAYHMRKTLGLSTTSAENDAGETVALEPLTDDSLQLWERIGETGAIDKYLTAVASPEFNLNQDKQELAKHIPIAYLAYNVRTQELIHWLLNSLTGGDYAKLIDGRYLVENDILAFKNATRKETTDKHGFLSIPETLQRQLGINPLSYHANKQDLEKIDDTQDGTPEHKLAVKNAAVTIGIKTARKFLRSIGLDIVRHREYDKELKRRVTVGYSIHADYTIETAQTAKRRAIGDNIPLENDTGYLDRGEKSQQKVS